MAELVLQEEDAAFLKEKGYEHELLAEGSELHVVIKGFQLPVQHYAPDKADLLIKIPPGYPNTQLDMFWTDPEVKKANGQPPLKTESREQHHGRTWQRWSRHYASGWRPSIDRLRNFVQSINTELQKGI